MEFKQAYIELIIALGSDERIDLNPNLFPDLEVIKVQIANFTPRQFFTYLSQFSEHDEYNTYCGYSNRAGYLSWYFSQLDRDCSFFNYPATIMFQLIHGINHLMITQMRNETFFGYMDPFLDLINLQTLVRDEDHEMLKDCKQIYGFAFDQTIDFDRFGHQDYAVSFRDLYIAFGVPVQDGTFEGETLERLEPKLLDLTILDVNYRTDDATIKKMKKILSGLKQNQLCPLKFKPRLQRVTFLNN
jgi:hypothetical protein